MTTFVLVHGAWGGAHGFRHVRRLLRAKQHDVFTPSLTGVGERIHLSSPQVGLGTHIRDVVNHVLYEDLDRIVLLGFSYGGFVVTGALEHIAERVAHLVYLDAFVPQNGESVSSHLGRPARAKIELGQDWLVTGPARDYDNPAEGEWMAARRTTHPQGCFTEPVFLSQPLESFPFTRTYIKATRAPENDIGNDAFWRAARHAKDSPAWRYHEIATNHMVANNRPEELTGILADIA
ncbi:alpha/beta hydrolase family protein [Bradyrhizobium sp. Cp5.3]|uniref:alpha/beta hydrolase n=1 Tax=Bradyrhizobium sp. Cp5.3 TaxID=443598 RepID=UPI00040E77F7|nr:alpha/beta hydrolase family protein [Bradyrhizobium sp. Cp5.3]